MSSTGTTSSTATGAAARGRPPMTPAQWWALGLASVGSFMVILDMLVVATALTAIRATCTPRSATWTGRSTPTASASPSS